MKGAVKAPLPMTASRKRGIAESLPAKRTKQTFVWPVLPNDWPH